MTASLAAPATTIYSAGNGNDIIKGQAGDDVIDGGACIDRAGYWQRNSALGSVHCVAAASGHCAKYR